MLQRNKAVFLALIVFFLISNVYAASFGTFPYQIEKQSSDLELEYRIGFINPSSSPVEVNLSAEGSKEYNVTFSQKTFRMRPSNTDSPSGSNWYYVGEGRYAKIVEKSFQVDISRYRRDNSLSFPVRIEASTLSNSTENQSSSSKIIQVRDYDYRAEIDPSLRPEKRSETGSDSSWSDRFWEEETSESKEGFNLDQDKSSNQSLRTEEEPMSGNDVNSTDKKETESSNGLVNKTTLMLVAGIVLSVGYILVKV